MISFDNRGIGASVSRDGRLTIEDMATDALAIVDSLGVDCFHVAGHSMGGVIAQAVALRAPARIKSLALLCTFAKGKDGSKVTLPMLATALRMRIGTRAMRRNAFLELIMPARYLQETDRAALAARLQPLFGHDLANQPPIVMKQLGAMSKYDAGARLAGLGSIPTLVVSATEDRVAPPSTGQALAAAIPGSTYVEIARSRTRVAHPPRCRHQQAPRRALDARRTAIGVICEISVTQNVSPTHGLVGVGCGRSSSDRKSSSRDDRR